MTCFFGPWWVWGWVGVMESIEACGYEWFVPPSKDRGETQLATEQASEEGFARCFLQYKSRLQSQIRHQGTNEDSAPPLTALETQFVAVCGVDPVTGCTTEKEHSNSSIASMSNEPSDCDSEQEMKYSDNKTSKSEPKHSVSNRLEVFGKIVELKLQELPENQRVIAEKIINEAMSMAQNGRLTMAHALNFAKSHKS